jgi:hypothetical protein
MKVSRNGTAAYVTDFTLCPSPGPILNFLESQAVGQPRYITRIDLTPDISSKAAGFDGRAVLHVKGRKPEAGSYSLYNLEQRAKLVSPDSLALLSLCLFQTGCLHAYVDNLSLRIHRCRCCQNCCCLQFAILYLHGMHSVCSSLQDYVGNSHKLCHS